MSRLLTLLRDELEEEAFQKLMEATDDGEKLPFGPGSADHQDALLLTGDDELLEILVQCAEILGAADGDVPAPGEGTAARMVFAFEKGVPELDHFLASLRRNGFASSAVEGPEVHVFVYLEVQSDHEFFRSKETVKSLYELSSVARGRMPKGHRVD